MRAVISKAEIESALARRFGVVSPPPEKFSFAPLITGIAEIDALAKGFPRSAITEIIGAMSSGRTSLLFSVLAQATWSDETCALIDTSDSFDPASGAQAGIALDRLLWIRCNDLERAFKATDLVLQSGGFGLVMLDLADVAVPLARRIISSWWYRFRRAIEHTPTALMVISQTSCVRSCASVSLELKNNSPAWSCPTKIFETTAVVGRNEPPENRRLVLVNEPGPEYSSSHSLLLHGARLQINQQKPIAAAPSARFKVRATSS